VLRDGDKRCGRRYDWCGRCTDAPIIDCESAAAYQDDFGVFLRCEIRARPPLTSIYCSIDTQRCCSLDIRLVSKPSWWSRLVSVLRPNVWAPSLSQKCALDFDLEAKIPVSASLDILVLASVFVSVSVLEVWARFTIADLRQLLSAR